MHFLKNIKLPDCRKSRGDLPFSEEKGRGHQGGQVRARARGEEGGEAVIAK